MRRYLYVLFGAIFLGTLGFFVKLVGDSLHSMSLSFYRVFFAFLTLLVICPFLDKKTFKASKKDLRGYAFVGFVFAVALSLTNIAFLSAPVQNVALIISLNPFFVLFFAYFLLKEKITKTKIVTLFIAIVGLVIINPLSSGVYAFGNLLALVVAAVDGFLITLMRREDKDHGIGDVMWFFFFATIFLLPFPFIYGFAGINLWLILMGVVSTGLTYLFLNLALEKMEAEVTSIFVIIFAPLVAILLAIFLLNESVDLRVLIGGSILILAGIYLQTHTKRIKKG